MASLKDLKARINSISSTRQITSAMKMVAAAKLQKSQKRIVQARPYADDIEALIKTVITRNTQEKNPFLRNPAEKDIKSVAIITLAGDKGLCGAFNQRIIKETVRLIKKNKGKKVGLFCVGKKPANYFIKHNPKLVKEKYINLFNNKEFYHSKEIMQLATQGFLDKEYDKLLLVYNEFKSAISQEIVTKQLLPLDRELLEEEAETEKKSNRFQAPYLLEPSAGALLTDLIKSEIDIQIWRAFLESYSAEQAARMTSMDNATDNADEMIEDLTLEYHHKRQENITTEIIEVASAVEAL